MNKKGMEVKPTDKKEVKKAQKYTRINSICDAVRKLKGGKVATVGEVANQLYNAKGGKDNLVESKFTTRIIVRALQDWGVLGGDTQKFNVVR